MMPDESSGDERFSRLGLLGQSVKMRGLYDLIARFARSPAPVLIVGGPGSGKELVTKACHALSGRKRFVPVNCSEISETLFASEMFGHVKGAFTGAISDRVGRFKWADGGTLFLDEISTLCPENQAKLLRAIQEKEIIRVGEQTGNPTPVDARIIAATNEDLEVAVSEKRFRADLLDRLAQLTMVVPPLRERDEDVVLLARHFLAKMAAEEGKNHLGHIGNDVLDKLRRHSWPGNVRELEKVIRRAVVMSSDDDESLSVEHIQFGTALHPDSAGTGAHRFGAVSPPRSPREAIADLSMDALLASQIPLSGLRRGDDEIGAVAGAIVEGVVDGFRRYLGSEAGEKALRSLATDHLLHKLGLRPRAGNQSRLLKTIREKAARAIADARAVSPPISRPPASG